MISIRMCCLRLFALFVTFRTAFQTKQNLVLKNPALRQQLITFKAQHPRPRISRFERILWVWLRRLWGQWKSALWIVNPETVVAWHRAGFRLYWSILSRSDHGSMSAKRRQEMMKLVRRLAQDNPTWGAPRIHGELLKLGFTVKERTISRYLTRYHPPSGKKGNWFTLIQTHRHAITAMDFFIVPTLFFFRPLYAFFIIIHEKRRILHFNVTFHPTAIWVKAQLKIAFSKTHSIKFLLFDNDAIFSTLVVDTLKKLGIEAKRTAFKSLWQNGIVERFVSSVRRDLLYHVIVFNEHHLSLLLKDYVDYYHHDRTHYNLEKETPSGRPIQPKPNSAAKLIALPRVGGLHHRYAWKNAA